MTIDELRAALLPAILAEVPFGGLNAEAVAAGARHLGISDADIARAFPGGVRDIIDYWNAEADAAMAAGLAQAVDMKVRQRVTLAVRLRLMHLARHREAVRRTFSVLALPGNQLLAGRILYRTVDEIWHACGDRSADFNFYTKRGLLAAVYSATVMVWLDDDSDGFTDTWDFLDRRIVDVMKIPQAVSSLKDLPRRLLTPGLRRRPARS
ncbi:COQ9 family protein [Lacibacterium aquatile]|uniref:COQ9 family protein n=1 Tax=Lacibacterium aquatile TaxID=1168082 RepID=A0ABW5DSD7_9PROT